MAKTNNMTVGKPMSLIIAYYIPAFFGTMCQQLYSIVDTIVVGKGIDGDALAAVGASGAITFFIFGFIMGLASGMSVLMSQAFGAGDDRKLRKSLTMGVLACGTVTLIIMIIALIVIKPLLILMHTAPRLLDDALLYVVIIIVGIPITLIYNCLAGVLNALGNSKTPLIAVILATVINIILDILFIMGFGMGVEGVAIATLIAQVFSAVFCYMELRNIKMVHLKREDWKPDFSIILAEMIIGIPVALMNSITAIGCILLQYFVNALGPAYTAAYTACLKITQFLSYPTSTLGMTMRIYSGQNLGAGKLKRIKEGLFCGFKITCVITAIGSVLLIVLPEPLMYIVVNEREIVDISLNYLRICGLMMWSLSLLFLTRSSLEGMGSTFVPMISGILELVARVVVVFAVVDMFKYDGIAIAEVAAWLSALVLNAGYLFIKLRRLSRIYGQ